MPNIQVGHRGSTDGPSAWMAGKILVISDHGQEPGMAPHANQWARARIELTVDQSLLGCGIGDC